MNCNKDYVRNGGVRCEVIKSITYLVNGCEVSQNEARIYAMRVTGKFLKRNDWDWS